jgi:hypothetical protein
MKALWVVLTVVLWLVSVSAAAFGGHRVGFEAGREAAVDIRQRFAAERAVGPPGAAVPGSGAAAGVQGSGAGAGVRQMGGVAFTVGEVKEINGDTMQLSTATEVLSVKLSEQTQIEKTGQASRDDLLPGTRITVQGSRHADGSFVAQTVQIGGRLTGGNAGRVPGAGTGN